MPFGEVTACYNSADGARVRQSIGDIVGEGVVALDLRTTLVLARKA